MLTTLLTMNPKTLTDALHLYNLITTELALTMASKLPLVEAKSFLTLTWVE